MIRKVSVSFSEIIVKMLDPQICVQISNSMFAVKWTNKKWPETFQFKQISGKIWLSYSVQNNATFSSK